MVFIRVKKNFRKRKTIDSKVTKKKQSAMWATHGGAIKNGNNNSKTGNMDNGGGATCEK